MQYRPRTSSRRYGSRTVPLYRCAVEAVAGAPPIRARLLGQPVVFVDGEPMRVDTRKAVAAFAYLVLTRRPAPRDVLAARLWPDSGEPEARAALRRTLSVLNAALGGRGLAISREAVGLVEADLDVDVWQFHQALASARDHRHVDGEACQPCVERLGDAVALVRGELLDGFTLRDSEEFDDWLRLEREAVRRELSGALERLVRAVSAAGRWSEAIEASRRWLELDELNEAAHRALIRALASAGETSAATAQYRACVRILDRELGVGPARETVELHDRIASGGLVADAPRASGPDREAGPRLASGASPLPFVGRDREASAIEAGLRRAGAPTLVVIEGEAGVGKTRILEAVLGRSRLENGRILAARCHEGEGTLAYAPIVAALRGALEGELGQRLAGLRSQDRASLARLLPDLGDGVPGSAAPEGSRDPAARLRFLEGLVFGLEGLLDGDPPGILAIDDVQWADDATLELLAAVVHRSRGSIAIVAGLRPEDLGGSEAWLALVAAASRVGRHVVVDVPRLDSASVTTLVRSIVPDATDELIDRLVVDSEGLPLVLVEALAILEAGDAARPPSGMRAILASRLHAVGDTDRQVLAAAAIHGRPAHPDLLRAISGRSEDETIDALDVLVARRLLAEAPGATYAPAHGRIREVVVESVTLARRRLLHRRAAEALAGRPVESLGDEAAAARLDGGTAALVAAHLQAAGRDREAALAYARAGDHDRLVHANAEAAAHYETAIGLGHPQPARLHEAIGRLRTLAGDYDAAVAAYRTALALAGSDDRVAASRIEHEVGVVHARRGEWELAERSMAAADGDDGAGASAAERALRAADRALVAHRRGRRDEARSFASAALAAAVEAEDAEAQARAENLLGLLATAEGDYAEAARRLAASLERSTALPDPTARIAALNNLARVRALTGDGDAAIRLVDAALELCRAMGDRHREAALLNHRADLLNAAGDRAAALEELRRAVTIFADVAGRQEPQPGVWLLEAW